MSNSSCASDRALIVHTSRGAGFEDRLQVADDGFAPAQSLNQGKGFGELLLIDAVTRARRIYTEAGGIGLFVDAINEKAAAYYLRFGFEPSPDNSLLLFLSARLAG